MWPHISGEWWAPFVEGAFLPKKIAESKGWPPINDEAMEAAGKDKEARHYDLFNADFKLGDEFISLLTGFPASGNGCACSLAVAQ